jgi:hypothetical protein
LHEEELERVRIGADRLVHGLPLLPVGDAPVGAGERVRGIDEPTGPGERQGEDSPEVRIGALVGEAPGTRAHGRFEEHARPERVPVSGPLLSEPYLTRSPRQELVPRVPKDPDPRHQYVEAVVADRDDAADDALRDAPLANEPLDASRHLGPVRKRDRERVDRREALPVVVHRRRISTSAASAIIVAVRRLASQRRHR